MNKDELVALRDQILRDIVPLVLDNADKGSDQFALLLRIIQTGNASKDVYNRAYESAKSIDDTQDKLEALLSLVDEIDIDANRDEYVELTDQESATDTTPDQPIEQQPTGNNDQSF